MSDWTIAPVGHIRRARARNRPNSSPDHGRRDDPAGPDQQFGTPPLRGQTTQSRKSMTRHIDVDANTGRWVLQVKEGSRQTAQTQSPGEIELHIREYADAGLANRSHTLSREL